MNNNDEKQRMRWRCRRGMLELDWFLMHFFDDCFDQLTPAQKKTFKELLEAIDPNLYDWFNGKTQPADPEQAALCEMIRNHVRHG